MDQSQQSQPASAVPIEQPSPAPRRRLPRWVSRPLGWCRIALKRFAQFLLIAWGMLAIFYSNLPWPWARTALAIAFAAGSIWVLWVTRRPRMRWAFAGAFAAVVVWWICIPPLQYRPWRPEVAVLPRAQLLDDDRVRLSDFRNFDYHLGGDGSNMPRTATRPRVLWDFDVRYETREVRISHIISMDWFISYWKIGPVAHTFVSFNFDDGTLPVCMSIEARPEIGEGFAPIQANFKQFELIYVVGDERDLVRVRTNFREEDVFMYRVRMSPESAQELFRIYLKRVNELAERPEWYHLLSNSCTLNTLRYARAAGAWNTRFDHRFLLNGLIDRYMFGAGVIDTDLPFDELRRRSHINEAAVAAGDAEDFSARIRASLPPRATPPPGSGP